MESIVAEDLIIAIDNNINYFDNSEKFRTLFLSLCQLKLVTEKCVKAIEKIRDFASEYDFDDDSPGNGYRSFINISDSAFKQALKICKRMIRNRKKLLFSADNNAKKVGEWSKIFESLSQIFDNLIELHQSNKNGSLFTDNSTYDNIITRAVEHIDQESFYGENIAFQFVPSLRQTVKLIVASFASYYKFYHRDGSAAVSAFRLVSSFMTNVFKPDKRAAKYIRTCENASTEYCSSFWFLTEGRFLHTLPEMAATKVEVNKVFSIQPQSMKIFSEKYEGIIDVPLPSSHIGLQPVKCRLVSKRNRQGMFGMKSDEKSADVSKHLIFHVHGGGFASQTSKSHQVYLRKWAAELDVPILSVDYSLTPDAPFPRAIEEIFYAYCWVLNNPGLVGSTGENIIFVGDSAGANLITSCTIKCIEMGIKKPKGILNIYGTFLINYSVSPARFLSLIDPFLPYLITCALSKSYCEDREDEKTREEKISFQSLEEKFTFKFQSNHFISPHIASDEILAEFPPTRLLSTDMDPFLDDSIEFGKKLKKLKVDATVDIVKGLPHGFLYFGQFSKECQEATMDCLEKIKSLLKLQ